MTTEFEKKMGFTADKAAISRGISIAIALEKKSKKIYLSIFKKSGNRIFSFLAGEEDYHLRLLNELKESLLKGRKMKASIKISKMPEPSAKGLDDTEIILSAMKFEKESRELYEKLAKTSGNREFFSKLAEFEQRHYDLLNGILDSFTNLRMET